MVVLEGTFDKELWDDLLNLDMRYMGEECQILKSIKTCLNANPCMSK